MERGNLRERFLEQQEGGRRASNASSVLAASSIKYGRQRTLARQQTKKERRARESQAQRILSRLASPFVQAYDRFLKELNSLSLPFKAGLAASLCSILSFAPGALSAFNATAAWAVVTVDLVLETYVGITFSQGINQTLGTLGAAMLGLLVMWVSPMCGDYESYFLVLCVFVGPALGTMCKSRLHPRWNLGVTFSVIIFHALILSKGEQKDKMIAPMILLIAIVIGFFMTSLVNLCVAPKFAGTRINELVANNFARAGNAIERCVVAYCEGQVLEHAMVNILAGKSEDENVHNSYDEIFAADSEVTKLLQSVPFEPCHGRFFFRYPWDLYDHILENLRYFFLDVVELDSCLHSEIQAPMHLRQMFEDEFLCIGQECAAVLCKLGESIRTMQPRYCRKPLEKAEEGVLLLQHKIATQISSLLEGPGRAVSEIARKAPQDQIFEENVTDAFQEAIDDPTFIKEGAYLDPQATGKLSNSDNSDNSSNEGSARFDSSSHLSGKLQDFIHRRDSMSRQWDTTVQRISALSLIKFSALLVELVVRARYVVTVVEELEIKGRFAENEGNFATSTPEPGNQQV